MKRLPAILLLTGLMVTAANAPLTARVVQSTDGILVAQTDSVGAIAIDFINLLVAGRYEAALQQYDLASRPDLSAESLEYGWEELVNAVGDFQRVVSLEQQPFTEPNLSLVLATLEFSRATLDFYVLVNQDNKIVSINRADAQLPISPEISARTAQVEKKAQEFIGLMVIGSYEAALSNYAPTVRITLTPEDLARGWQNLLAQYGDFEQLTSVEVEPFSTPPGAALAIVTCQFEQDSTTFYVLLDSENAILGISPAD